jgi:hypothetical protein
VAGEGAQSSSKVIAVLRSTLKQLEQPEDLATDDRALGELKNSIARTIAELELRSDHALSDPRSDHVLIPAS